MSQTLLSFIHIMATISMAEKKKIQTRQDTQPPKQEATWKPAQRIVDVESGPILAQGRQVLRLPGSPYWFTGNAIKARGGGARNGERGKERSFTDLLHLLQEAARGLPDGICPERSASGQAGWVLCFLVSLPLFFPSSLRVRS